MNCDVSLDMDTFWLLLSWQPSRTYSQLIIFLWTPDASAPVQGLWEQNLVLPVQLQLPFYLEKVGLAGELVAELFNFIFGKAG